MIALDVVILFILITLYNDLLPGLEARSPFSVQLVLIAPLLYVIGGIYILFNAALLAPRTFVLAQWRLLAYAFPSAQEHKKHRISKNSISLPRLIDLFGWITSFTIIGIAIAMGYAVLAYPMIYTSIIMIVLIISAIFILTGLAPWNPRRRGMGDLSAIIYGNFIITLFVVVLFFITKGGFPYYPQGKDRFVLTILLATPVMLISINNIHKYPSILMSKIRECLKKAAWLRAIINVANAATLSAFDADKCRTMRTIIVAIIIVLYLILPGIANICIQLGITRISGYPLSTLLDQIKIITNSSMPPKTLNGMNMIQFVFGHNGIVLTAFLWYFSSLMAWTDASDGLSKVPNLCSNRRQKFVVRQHYILFILLFLPFLFVSGLMLPIATAILLGPKFSVFFSVIVFGMFFPKLTAYLLSIGYLIAVFFNTYPHRFAVDINNATLEELKHLPGILDIRAKRIISNRPISNLNKLSSIIGEKATFDIKDMVEFYQ